MYWRALIFSAVLVLGAVLPSQALAEKKIGILLWSDGSGYPEAKNGIINQLAKEGFGASSLNLTVEGANGNKAKAMEIAQRFAKSNFDVVIPIGTSAALAVAKEIKDSPVVFSMVFDPVDSKIAEAWKSSGNNTTGASSKVPMDQLLERLKQLAPVKTVAVLYTPGEKNSEIQLREIQHVQSEQGIKAVPVPITSSEDITHILPDVASRVDALYLTGSSVVTQAIAQIVDIASKARVITVTHLGENVQKGVLLGVSANPYEVGLLAGAKAAKVLKGAKPSSVPIDILTKLDVILNTRTAKTGHIDIPPSFLRAATQTID